MSESEQFFDEEGQVHAITSISLNLNIQSEGLHFERNIRYGMRIPGNVKIVTRTWPNLLGQICRRFQFEVMRLRTLRMIECLGPGFVLECAFLFYFM